MPSIKPYFIGVTPATDQTPPPNGAATGFKITRAVLNQIMENFLTLGDDMNAAGFNITGVGLLQATLLNAGSLVGPLNVLSAPIIFSPTVGDAKGRIYRALDESRLDITMNAYRDGGSWYRDDIALGSYRIALTPGGLVLAAAPAGANPIVYDDLVTLNSSSLWSQKAFQSVSMSNSWVAYGAGTWPLEVRKLRDTNLLLRGSIKSGTYADSTEICVLPAGSRPLVNPVTFPIASDAVAAGKSAKATAYPSGSVLVFGLSGNTRVDINAVIPVD